MRGVARADLVELLGGHGRELDHELRLAPLMTSFARHDAR
jgi:hypothetical protein